MSFKIVTQSDQEIQVPSRPDVAAASHPKKAIITEMKQQQKEKTGKVYTVFNTSFFTPKRISGVHPLTTQMR